jgi:plasmid maintenance system antidote protein VapI
MNSDYQPLFAFHPVETLLEKLEELGMSFKDFATEAGLGEHEVGDVDITPEMAKKYEAVLGIPEHFWLNKQKHYNKYVADLIALGKQWKYIYYEIHTGSDGVPSFHNYNILLNKPSTGRSGTRLFKNINSWTGSHLVVEQVWVDLTAFDFEYQKNQPLTHQILEAIKLLSLVTL